MADRVEIRDDMTSVDAGWTLTLPAERFLPGVLGGKDFLRFPWLRIEVRGGMVGFARAPITVQLRKCSCKGGTRCQAEW